MKKQKKAFKIKKLLGVSFTSSNLSTDTKTVALNINMFSLFFFFSETE